MRRFPSWLVQTGPRMRPVVTSLIVTAGAVWSLSLVWTIPGHTYDFVYDWLSARAFVSGMDPYLTLSELADHFGLHSNLDYVHPRIPAALVVLSPIGFIPYAYEYVAGRLLVVASAYLLAVVLGRMARVRSWIVISLVPIGLMIWPLSEVLSKSSTDFFVAALIGATFLLTRRHGHWLAGLPLGVAVSMKLWPWLLLPALLLKRKYKPAAGAFVTFAVLNAAALALPHVSPAGVLDALASAATATTSLSVSTVFGINPLLPQLIGLSLLIRLSRSGELSWEEIYVYGVPIALLAAPILWVAYLSSLLVPIAWFIGRGGWSFRESSSHEPAPMAQRSSN